MREYVYQTFLEAERPPTPEATARSLGQPAERVRASLKRLADAHVLVLEKDGVGIRMAMPFSGVPTSFRVETGERGWWANCIWDALGIPAMLKSDATITARCGDCGETEVLLVKEGKVATPAGSVGSRVAHFAVPAARWWDDVRFT